MTVTTMKSAILTAKNDEKLAKANVSRSSVACVIANAYLCGIADATENVELPADKTV